MTRLLDDADWQRIGGRTGLYVRYRAPGRLPLGTPSSVIVPLDTTAPDFPELISEALGVLAAIPGDGPDSALLTRLLAVPSDEFSFEKDTVAPRGWIQWDQGMSLLQAARALLASGAKSARERRKYYGNRYGQFANRFLDNVMMGQTAIASYVVRAYVPSDENISTGSTLDDGSPHLPGVGTVPSRSISEKVVGTLQSAEEALEHYRSHQSLSGFSAPDSPLSYESVVALKHISQDANDSAIRVLWESVGSSAEDQDWQFVFTPDNASVFERAAMSLVETEPQRRADATGTVHLLSRSEPTGPGVVGLTTLTGEPAKKIRVRLESEDYHRAITAHEEDHAISVTGDLEREGTLTWLYRATITEVGEIPIPSDHDPERDSDDRLF